MFRTKKDVDKHCQEVFKKFQTEKDRNLRSLSIAQQYYNVRDYESAKRYVTMYLSVKDDSSVAHKLLAQCHEYFGDNGKALAEYKYSFVLDPKQPELILKVCELLGDRGVSVDKNQANYWYEKGKSNFPYHPAIFQLQQKICALGDVKNMKSMEFVIIDEVKVKPYDPSLHVKLLSFYIENGRIKDAYDKIFSTNSTFVPNVQWYQCGVKICKLYKTQFPTSLNDEFYAKYLLVSERSLALAVQNIKISRRSIPDCISFLSRFDEILTEASALVNKTERFLRIIYHMCGQLCFHTANILYRKMKWEDSNWQEMNQLIAPLLLLSTAELFSIRNVKPDGTFCHILKSCIQHNIYRISQAGFVLLSMAKHSEEYFIEKVLHFCAANDWKECITQKIYNISNYKEFSKSSFFMNYAAFSNFPSELPKNLLEDVDHFLYVIEVTQPSSLHHLVWLGLQCLSLLNQESICDILLPLKFSIRTFNSLQFAHNCVTSSYAESLCKLDVEAFLYACVYCAKSSWAHQADPNKPQSLNALPADVSKVLCLPEHEQWWEYVYQMVNKTETENNFSRVRSVLQRGIEMVRLVGNSNLPVQLLVLLGRTFANKATVESDSDRASALESRALLYWKAALPTLQKIVHDESYSSPLKSFFPYYGKIISKNEAVKLTAEGKRYIGMQLIKEKDYSINESYDNVIDEDLSSMSSKLNLNSTHDKILQTVYEQNIKIMDKLETLFNKQELLSSNQLQLFETVSMLEKKIEDVVIIPNECNFDGIHAALRSFPPQNSVALSNSQNINVDNKCSMSTSVQSNFASTRPLASTNVQTNFPMYPFTHSSLTMPTNVPLAPMYWSNSPCLNNSPLTQVIPTTQFQFHSSFLNKSNSSPKESYSTVNQSGGNINIAPAIESFNFGSVTSVNNELMLRRDFSMNLPTTSTTFDFKNLCGGVTNCLTNSSQDETVLFSSANTTPVINSASSTVHSFQIPIPNLNSIIQTPPIQIPNEYEESDEERVVEHDPIPDFKPIIPLPDEIDVKTGEEGEEVLFENRAKLFRFADKEWKERGIGTYKMLKNPDTGKIRVLMRREIVHKVCANHYLTEDMNLTPMANSDRAWIYCAPDYAEEKLKIEKFCIKFKTVHIAQEFFRVFNVYKLCNSTSASTKPLNRDSATSLVSATDKMSSPSERNADKLQKAVISPAVSKTEDKNGSTAIPHLHKTQLEGFTFFSKPVVNAVPDQKESEKDEGKKKMLFSSFPGFSLDSLSRTENGSKIFLSEQTLAKSDASELSPFASVKNTIDFSSLSRNSSETTFVKSKDFKGFAGAGSLVFGHPSTSSKSNENSSISDIGMILKNLPKKDEKLIENVNTNQVSNVTCEDEFVPTAEFKPVIPLPDLIEVKTGEEGLEVLYEEHCKLYRFVNNEWKERGVGKMKILHHPTNGFVQLLMRRDQVHKVCCNQRLTVDHELKPLKTTDKAWSWYGQDFSEGELQTEFLCVRFKTSDLAEQFKNTFNKAKSMISGSKENSVAASANSTTTPLPSLSEMFKRDQNTWECKTCYVVNEKDALNCAACSQPKPGLSEVKSTQSDAKFTFGFGNLKSSLTSVDSDKKENPNTTRSPGIISNNINTESFKFCSASTSFFNESSVFRFGSLTNTQTNTNPLFTFSSSVSSSSSSTAHKDKPRFSFSDPSPQKSESGGFLFGDLSNGSINNTIGTNSFTKASDNSNVFPSVEIKTDHRLLVEHSDVTGQTQASDKNKQENGNKRSTSSDEVEFISETSVSEEEKQLAESLMLPPNYFTYKYSNKDCPGCVGCAQEDKEKNESSQLEMVSPETNSVGKQDDYLKNMEKYIAKERTTYFPDKVDYIFGGSGEFKSANTFNFGKIFNQPLTFAGDALSEKTLTEDESDNENTSIVSHDHDPHFEPVISLPDIVESKTGEEDEIIKFSQKSKIFRFDEEIKGWKERGVGELKVLYHPVQKSYRLLLRREQVHKIVLNQRITASLNLQPMSLSKNSLCWFGMNLPEEQTEPILEKLAARFKTEEITNDFHQVVTKCLSLMNAEHVPQEKCNKKELNEGYPADSSKNYSDNEDENDTESTEETECVNYEKNESENCFEADVYNDNDSEKWENEFYVDEQGIKDAMEDLADSEIVFEYPVTLQVLGGDSAADYDGILRLVRKKDVDENGENVKPYVVFSTSEIPSLYKVDVDNEKYHPVLENNSVTFLSDESENENNIVLMFSDPKIAEEFTNIYEMINAE